MTVTREASGYRPPALKFKRTAYPQSPNIALPRTHFVMAAVGPRGSGKTYSVVSLLKAFEQEPPRNADDGSACGVRTILISPTADANPVFTSLKSLDEEDIHRTYSEEVLQEILDSIKEERAETERYREKMKLYRKWLKIKDLSQLKPEELLQLELDDFAEPQKPKYPNGCCVFLVCDDLVGSSIYKQTGRNPFTNLLLRNRHHAVSIVMMSQSLKSLPRTVRANVSVWLVCRFGTRSHLPDLYEECGSALCTEEQFEQLYDEATREDHGSLVVDFTAPKERRFSAGFQEILKIS